MQSDNPRQSDDPRQSDNPESTIRPGSPDGSRPSDTTAHATTPSATEVSDTGSVSVPAPAVSRSSRWRTLIPRASLGISALVIATIFADGAWQRRWIADDGLIVLRTVRNLLAGNGPVFNKGERVEANTSTVWTYLVWFWSWVTQGQTEYVVLWVSLVLSVTALPLAMWGTYRMLGLSKASGVTLILPLGPIVYIALPPARDFATSGLEVSLVLFWTAGLWCQMVAWARRDNPTQHRGQLLALAFTAGLSPLVRPELTLVGGLALLLVFLTRMSWRLRIAFVAVAALLPVGYQIFRMGYYGLLVPNTAVAKDASGSKWSQGFTYLGNLFSPYTLLLPLIIALVAAVIIWWLQRAPITGSHQPRSRTVHVRERLHSTSAVVTLFLLAGVVESMYWIRQGGDFMHGRVLLAPLFLLLLPIMVVPLRIPDLGRRSTTEREVAKRSTAWRRGGECAAAVVILGFFVTTVVWGVITSQSDGMHNGASIGRSGIVDERRFYSQNLSVKHPITAADYRNYGRISEMVKQIKLHRDTGGFLVESGDYDKWYYDPHVGRSGGKPQLTVYFLNLGMTSMNAPLDVRVIDPVGLANPLASHTERLDDARIGHDKNLPDSWVIVDSGAGQTHPDLPWFVDTSEVKQAHAALTCGPTQDLLASYRAPITWSRFRHNVAQSPTFTDYRINRIPRYELQRCEIPNPAPLPTG